MLDKFRAKVESERDKKDAQSIMRGLFYATQELQVRANAIEGKTPEDEKALVEMQEILEQEAFLLLTLKIGEVMALGKRSRKNSLGKPQGEIADAT